MAFLDVFTGFFEGVWKKSMFFGWCFGGEIVVRCVVNVEFKTDIKSASKNVTRFSNYFLDGPLAAWGLRVGRMIGR